MKFQHSAYITKNWHINSAPAMEKHNIFNENPFGTLHAKRKTSQRKLRETSS